jgi:hypothetical protein
MKKSLVKVIVHQLKIDEIFQFHFSYRVVFDGGHCRCRRRKVPGVNVVKLYIPHCYILNYILSSFLRLVLCSLDYQYSHYEESVVVRIKSNLLLMIFWLHIINYNS